MGEAVEGAKREGEKERGIASWLSGDAPEIDYTVVSEMRQSHCTGNTGDF